MRAMRIALGIAEGMVHTVHNRIGAGHQVARSLAEPGKKVEQLFTLFTRGVHLMRCIPMKEKRMEKQGQEPMREKENQNCNHF